MDNLQLLKEEIYGALKDSILLSDATKAEVKKRIVAMNDYERAKGVLTVILRERDYIIAYLKQVIKVDTTGLTVYKLRQLIQNTYIKRIQGAEASNIARDVETAENVLKGHSL